MSENNDRLMKIAMKAIEDLFWDKSVSVEAAKGNLKNLIEEIEIMIDSLPKD